MLAVAMGAMQNMFQFKRKLRVTEKRRACMGYWQTLTIAYGNLFFTFKEFL
jgi:hypothetical protein